MKHIIQLTLRLLILWGCGRSEATATGTHAGTPTDSSATSGAEALNKTETDTTLNISLLGDSMTWIGGENCEKEEGWTHYLKERFPNANIDIYARSGATWTNTPKTKGDAKAYSVVIENENVLYNQVSRLINEAETDPAKRPDLIILYAGANDAWFEKRRPGLYNEIKTPADITTCKPSQCTTLASSIQLGVKKLQKAFPEARIVMVTPVEMAQTPTARITKVGDAIEKTGKELGVEVLRADKNVPIKHEEEKQGRRYTSDGAHTNPEGAKLIADFIISSIFTNN